MTTPRWHRWRLARLTAEAWIALAIYDLLQWRGFSTVHQRLERLHPAARVRATTPEVVWATEEACVWYVKRVACLQRSAVTTWLLRRSGTGADLVIGYRAVPFESHAWVEVNGRVVNDLPQYQTRFTVLERL